MQVRTLEGEDRARLYDAFRASFADYAVPVTMGREDFDAMHARRGYDPGLSLGAYDGSGDLIGFIFSGAGPWRGERAGYDMGTGVVPSARGSGLAYTLAEELKGLLRARGIGTYVLEVLKGNEAAIRTYRKAGFEVTRQFECPSGRVGATMDALPAGIELRALDAFPDWAAGFREWRPSWQNSDESIARSSGAVRTIAAFDSRGEAAGFVAATRAGSVAQLAVRRGSRRSGLGRALLGAVAAESGGDLRYVNVQSDDLATLGLLSSLGVAESLGQYEMELHL